jgi:hypothetical protein
MSQVIDLCEGDDNGEWPNAASAPPLPLSRKRRRDKENEESFNDAHPRNENGSGKKTAAGWAEFVFDVELADEVKVRYTLHRKRRSVMKSERSAKNDAARKIAQTLKEIHTADEDVGSEDAQVVDYEESHRGSAATASHPMNSDPEKISRDDGSANKHPQSRSTSKGTAWEDRLNELADYRKVHGHCNVPKRYSENTKLGRWVARQRSQYRYRLEGKTSQITLPRIEALESLCFEWSGHGATCAWEERLSELVDFHKIHGHCNVPWRYSENTKLGSWVTNQRSQYRFRLEGKTSSMTFPRIEALESLGFEWSSHTDWEDRLSELADYRKVHGHCNVPRKYSENAKLGTWVTHQRSQYSLHLKGKTSQITLPRIQALESLCFEWSSRTDWEDRLSELSDYRKVHGHCNVPQKYSENSRLGTWVATQRYQYSLHLKGKISSMTLPRIEALERLGFEWKPSISRTQGTTKKSNLDDDVTSARERAVESAGIKQTYGVKMLAAVKKAATIMSTSLSNPNNPTGRAKSTSTLFQVEAQKQKLVNGVDSLSDETELVGSPSKPAAKRSLYPDRHQAEANSRDDASQAKLPCLAQQRKTINSFSHARLAAVPPENFSAAGKKPANSRQGATYQPEAALSNERLLRTNPVAPAVPLQQRHNNLLGDGSATNNVQATPDKPASAQQDALRQTPRDDVFQSDNVLHEELV